MRPVLLQFARAKGGVAALEFALVLPLLILMLLGSVELQRYMRIERQLSLAAENVAALVAQRQSADASDPAFEANAVAHIFPPATETGAAWTSAIVHQITNVVFTPTVAGCTSSCTYTANVAWVWPTYDTGFGRGSMKRNCGTLSAAATGAAISGANLPSTMFGAGSMVVVDLGYRFAPLFGSTLVSAKDMFRQGYASPRFASPYLSFPSGSAVRCSGY